MKTISDKAYRILMGTAMAVAGAGVIAGLQYLTTVDFGPYTPFVVAIASAMINALRVSAAAPKE